MKKLFLEPEIQVIALNAANIVCSSSSCNGGGGYESNEDPW